MKKYLRKDAFIRRDVPVETDVRILAAAAFRQQTRLRHRKIERMIFSGAAAAALLAAFGIFLHPGLGKTDLSTLADWTDIEQENYNLAGELMLGGSAIEYTDTLS